MEVKSPFVSDQPGPVEPEPRIRADALVVTDVAAAPEKKLSFGERLKLAAGSIATLIAVEHAAPHLPDSGPSPAISQIMGTSVTPVTSQPEPSPPEARTAGFLPSEPVSLTGVLHPGGGVALPDGSFIQTSNDPIDRMVTSISAAQPAPLQPPAASALGDTLRIGYRDVIDELQDHEKVAQIIADAILSKAVESAIEKLPELAGSVLVALVLNKRKNKEATPALDQIAEDLDAINDLYAEGVPLTTATVQRRLGISAARVRAAMQVGLYVEEWHPAGKSLADVRPAAPAASAQE